jgi:hypothetical protein
MSSINKARKQAIIAYLKDYIEISKRHKMYIGGVIGAGTSIYENEPERYNYDFIRALRSNISNILSDLYDDEGENLADHEDIDEIGDAVRLLLEIH